MSVRFFAANLSRDAVRAFDAAPMPPWAQSETGRWLWHLDLGPIAAGTIVIPSLTISDGEPYGFRFALDTPHGCVSLPGFGDFSRPTKPVANDHISTHIDYFGAIANIEQALLVLEVESVAAPEQRPMLLGVSQRSSRLDVPSPGKLSTALIDVPALCQRDAPTEIAMRICSPTCLAMAMRRLGLEADLLEVSRGAYDPGSGIYGGWGQSLYAASRYGVVAAVRTFDSLEEAAALLDAGLPIIASVRYAAGELHGSAVTTTDGHLILVCGFDGDRVVVNDPIAANLGEVRRSYALDEFATVWLRDRGAGYVMGPLADGEDRR